MIFICVQAKANMVKYNIWYLYGTDNFNGYDTAFRAEVSLDYWAAYKYQNNIFTNEVYDGCTDPAHSKWWTAMAWLNKLYRTGKEKNGISGSAL